MGLIFICSEIDNCNSSNVSRVIKLSLFSPSDPGKRCTWLSINPGIMVPPLAEIT